MPIGKQAKLREINGRIQKFCPHCERWKDRETGYSPKRGGNNKVHSWCKECCVNDVARVRRIRGRSASPLTERIQRILSNIICANGKIRSEYLRKLYEQQNGKCYYTGVQMGLVSKLKNDPLIMSCDRLDSKKGYVEGNVVLCCLGLNHLKGRFSKEYMYSNLKLFYEGAKQKMGWD